jgi:hypothetical protein
MDDFDQFNQPAQPTQNTNTQEDDLFGSGSITSTTDETSFNTFSNDQQVDPSWNVENVMKKRLFVINKCLVFYFRLGFEYI